MLKSCQIQVSAHVMDPVWEHVSAQVSAHVMTQIVAVWMFQKGRNNAVQMAAI